MFRILLVDDEKMALVSTEFSFPWAQHGMLQVDKCSDPYEALQMLETKRYDAAFLDIRMPEISGLGIMEICREKGIDTEFIMTTGYSEFEYARQALQLGAFDYCLKPIQRETTAPLLERLRECLWQKRLLTDPLLLQQMAGGDIDVFGLSGLQMNAACWGCAAIRKLPAALPSYPALWRQASVLAAGDYAVLLCSGDQDCSESLAEWLGAVAPSQALWGVVSVKRGGQEAAAHISHLLGRLLEAMEAPVPDGITQLQVDGVVTDNNGINALLRYLETHYTQELSLRELAAKFGLNYTYCSELFHSLVGIKFSQYVISLRMEHAKRLLLETSDSIEDIAYYMGFNNYSYFVRVFKDWFGMPPRKYRECNGKRGEPCSAT